MYQTLLKWKQEEQGRKVSSLKKFRTKYGEQLATMYVLHSADVKVENDVVYLPLYMAGML